MAKKNIKSKNPAGNKTNFKTNKHKTKAGGDTPPDIPSAAELTIDTLLLIALSIVVGSMGRGILSTLEQASTDPQQNPCFIGLWKMIPFAYISLSCGGFIKAAKNIKDLKTTLFAPGQKQFQPKKAGTKDETLPFRQTNINSFRN